MLPKGWKRPFTFSNEEEGQLQIRKFKEEGQLQIRNFNRFDKISNSVNVVGLRILIKLSPGESMAVVVKPNMKLKKPTKLLPERRFYTPTSYESNSFLKSCCLCNKDLSPEKDVYMYRGDQGFCSVECRSKQINMDEMKEIDASTKRMAASFRGWRCGPSDPCEARALLEEFRQRHGHEQLLV